MTPATADGQPPMDGAGGAPSSKLTTPGSRLPIRDAATLVIVDRTGPEPRILMGRRRPDQIFLPNKYVFPGGRIDPTDRTAPAHGALAPEDHALLLEAPRGRAAKHLPRALALAAIRETFEETGLVIGHRAEAGTGLAAATPWSRFLATGYLPALGALRVFARAITPPGRTRRFDTRFFLADAAAIAHRTDATDGELSSLDWFTLDEMRALDLPSITQRILGDLAPRLAGPAGAGSGRPIPFYCHRHGRYQRHLLSLAPSTP